MVGEHSSYSGKNTIIVRKTQDFQREEKQQFNKSAKSVSALRMPERRERKNAKSTVLSPSSSGEFSFLLIRLLTKYKLTGHITVLVPLLILSSFFCPISMMSLFLTHRWWLCRKNITLSSQVLKKSTYCITASFHQSCIPNFAIYEYVCIINSFVYCILLS